MVPGHFNVVGRFLDSLGVKNMKVCTRCVLPDTFPGIEFDSSGVCNFCNSEIGGGGRDDVQRYRDRFERLIEEKRGTGPYDVLVCYSGGKDSSYTLKLLRQSYDLRVLALTMDNGFMPGQTLLNISTLVEKLGADHILLKPRFDVLANIFRHCVDHELFPQKTAERASFICTACMSIVKFSALRLAIEKRIPIIGFGWSPGQAPISSSIMKNNPKMVLAMQKIVREPLQREFGDLVRPYFLEDEHFGDPSRFPYNVHPLAFLGYDEPEIYRSIAELGWKEPEHLDANSSNCLLNSFANVVHKNRFHFHPYAFEMAGLVRGGHLKREDALQRLNEEEDRQVVAFVKKRLELNS